jgi:hypothetical protein
MVCWNCVVSHRSHPILQKQTVENTIEFLIIIPILDVTKMWLRALFASLMIHLCILYIYGWFCGLRWFSLGVLGKPIIIHLYKIK